MKLRGIAMQPPGGRAKGVKATSTGQLSQGQKQLLLWVLKQGEAMKAGTPEQRITLLNRGVPWDIKAFCEAESVLPPSASRTLRRLEERELIACFASGEGRNRRVSHIKLSAQARRIAEGAEFMAWAKAELAAISQEEREALEAWASGAEESR